MRIGSNIPSLSISNALARTSKLIARSLERMSSGRRVSSAMDGDTLALTRGVTLEAQQRGLTQGMRNMNDSRGLLATASNAFYSQMDLLQRMREIAVQASSGTVTTNDRLNLNQELQGLMSEFRRITEETEFNGMRLLDGSNSTLKIHGGLKSTDSFQFDLPTSNTSQVFQEVSGSGRFGSATSFSSGGDAANTEMADLNNDGHLDVLISALTGSMRVYMGTGTGVFDAGRTISTLAGVMEVSDVSGDGILDVVAKSNFGTFMTVLVGNGDGTFRAPVTYAAGSAGAGQVDIKTGDLDGDGDLDIVINNFGDNNLAIYFNNGNGTFQSQRTIATENAPNQIYIADLNGDGKLDLVNPNAGSNSVSLHFGNGNGTFQSQSTFSAAGGWNHWDSKVGDYNNDGIADLMILVTSANSEIHTYLGNGNGTFRFGSSFAQSNANRGLTSYDVNSDGNLDFIYYNYSNIVVRLGNGNGSFGSESTYGSGLGGIFASSNNLSFGDLNEDGAIDMIHTPATGGGSQWYALLGISHTKNVTWKVNVETSSKAQELIGILDTALENVRSNAASIGASLNRLDYALRSNETLTERLAEAREQNNGIDIAQEVAELTRLQILQQAQVAALGQSNLNMQLVLNLLGNVMG